MSNLLDYTFKERKCPVCGKIFIAHEGWAYKKAWNGESRVYCSWKCLRKETGPKGTKAERQEKIRQAIRDGLTIKEIANLLGEEKKKIQYWMQVMEDEKDEENNADL